MKRRAVLTAIGSASIGAASIGTATAQPGNAPDRVVETIRDDDAWIVLPADECLGPVGGEGDYRREYLENQDRSVKARLTLQHDGDLEGEDPVRVLGSIGGELEPRYGSGVWRAQVHFGTQYGYVQSHSPPREIYLFDAEIVARPIRGDGDRPTLRAPVWVEIVEDQVGVSARAPADC